MSDKAKENDEAPKKKGKLPMILAVVVALGLGGGGTWFFMKGSGDKEGKDGVEKSADKVADDHKASALDAARKRDAGAPPKFVTLEPFTFNLMDADQDRFAQIGIVLEVADANVEGELDQLKPSIRNSLLRLLSSKTSRDLLTIEGKDELSSQIVLASNLILAGEPPPAIRPPKPRKKKKPKLIIKGKKREQHDDPLIAEHFRDDRMYEHGGYGSYQRSRGRSRFIPERVYAAHFSKFLVQ